MTIPIDNDELAAVRSRAYAAWDRSRQHLNGWRAEMMTLARELLRGRELAQGDDSAYGRWLADSKLGNEVISRDDRMALLNFARHETIATEF
jgi:hypothetical protein